MKICLRLLDKLSFSEFVFEGSFFLILLFLLAVLRFIILNKRANDFFKKSPEWAYFISLLTDNKFVYDALDLLDKPISDQRGFKYSFGKKVSLKPSNIEGGTSIEIKNIFVNTCRTNKHKMYF